jgi:hypothetical protein
MGDTAQELERITDGGFLLQEVAVGDNSGLEELPVGLMMDVIAEILKSGKCGGQVGVHASGSDARNCCIQSP